MQQIQALRFDVQQVGKHVKGSKKRFCWDISLKEKNHTIILDFSFISGKVKITVDRKILLQNQLPADVSFQYPFTLDGFALNIIQQGQSFQLRINNKVFSHLYTQQKTNTEFKKYQDQVKDIKVDIAHLNPQNKKVSLNIGAFGGMKKKKDSSESQSWNAFSGGAFPNYFGDAPGQPAEKPKETQKQSNLLDDQQQIAERTAKEFNLAQSEKVQEKKSENIFDLISSNQPTKQSINTSQQFGNMNEMFSSLSVSKSNEIDFFADQPASNPIPTPQINKEPQVKSGMFDFSQSSSGFGLGGFATGFGMEGNNLNQKSFATMSNNASKSLDLTGLDFTAKPKVEPNAFVKRNSQESASYDQMEQIFSSQVGQQPPTSIGFNNLQNMFQSGVGNPQPQKQQVFAGNSSVDLNLNKFQPPKQEDFNTIQLLFQTNSANQPSGQLNFNPNPYPEPLSKPNPLDMFNNSKPATFATLSGNNNFSNNTNFDMGNFGTMQPNTKSNLDINFFQSKPVTKSNTSGDLI